MPIQRIAKSRDVRRLIMTRQRHLQVVVSHGSNREDSCHHLSGHLLPLDILRLDESEEFFLKLFRYVCATIANQSLDGWQSALDLARQSLGETNGTIMVNAIVTLLHAIQDERRGEFSFMVADCPICSRRVSDEEKSTIDLIRSAFAMDDPNRDDRARALVGNGDCERLIAAAGALAGQLRLLARFNSH
jgi:hypothetical protein